MLVRKGFTYILTPPMAGQGDGDGVRIIADPGARLIVRWFAAGVAVVALAVVAAIVAIRFAPERPGTAPAQTRADDLAPRPVADAPATRPTAAAPGAPVVHVVPRRSVESEPPTPTSDGEPPPEKEPPMFEFAPAGVKSGVALFPPPGTKPLKRGIVVPDDFALPPGYVRHYQTTDDGKQLPPVLMFHPDYQPVDEHGRPVPVPKDGVVPPELAPPGLPIRMLDVPQQPTPDH